jgi:hypothetical protein
MYNLSLGATNPFPPNTNLGKIKKPVDASAVFLIKLPRLITFFFEITLLFFTYLFFYFLAQQNKMGSKTNNNYIGNSKIAVSNFFLLNKQFTKKIHRMI